jgi:5-methylcytosine-specific restriction protein A
MNLKTIKPRLATLVTQRIPTQEVERLRGRAAVERRARWLRDNPLCVECEAQGRVTAATVPDHVIPLWKGGRDDGGNLQSLCAACHDVKTKAEAAERASGG